MVSSSLRAGSRHPRRCLPSRVTAVRAGATGGRLANSSTIRRHRSLQGARSVSSTDDSRCGQRYPLPEVPGLPSGCWVKVCPGHRVAKSMSWSTTASRAFPTSSPMPHGATIRTVPCGTPRRFLSPTSPIVMHSGQRSSTRGAWTGLLRPCASTSTTNCSTTSRCRRPSTARLVSTSTPSHGHSTSS